MTRLSERKYAPFYDLFKLIVAVILAIILILLLLRGRQQLSPQPLATLTLSITTATSTPIAPTVTETAMPVTTSAPEIQPTATLTAPKQNPLPTSTPVVQPTSTESIPTSDPNTCPSAPAHIQMGNKVRVLHWLYLRTHPGLNSQIILTNKPGAVMDVIGGPVCTLKSTTQGSKAYLWWIVRTENGREGWSAEAPLNLPYYFMETIR